MKTLDEKVAEIISLKEQRETLEQERDLLQTNPNYSIVKLFSIHKKMNSLSAKITKLYNQKRLFKYIWTNRISTSTKLQKEKAQKEIEQIIAKL